MFSVSIVWVLIVIGPNYAFTVDNLDDKDCRALASEYGVEGVQAKCHKVVKTVR